MKCFSEQSDKVPERFPLQFTDQHMWKNVIWCSHTNALVQVFYCCTLQLELIPDCFEFRWTYTSSKCIVRLSVWEMKADTGVIYTVVTLAVPRSNSLIDVFLCVIVGVWTRVCVCQRHSLCLFTCLCINNSVFSCDSFVTFHRRIPGLLTVVGAQHTHSATPLLFFPSDESE